MLFRSLQLPGSGSAVFKDFVFFFLTAEFKTSLGVNRVITGSVDKLQDMGNVDQSSDPYGAARQLGILEVVPSLNTTTERSTYEAHIARALKVMPAFDAVVPIKIGSVQRCQLPDEAAAA